MGFLALKNSIGGKVTGLLNNLGLGTDPEGCPHLTDYNDLYEDKPNKNFAKSLGYGFKVTSEYGLSYKSGWKEFKLQINPQTLDQDEEFSIQFFPTPKGIVVEHQGSIMKDIVISGVTGIHPRRSVGGVEADGDLIFQTGDSGYKQFHDLRNYIRSYVEHKKDPKFKHYRLAFYNFKDFEFFFVEPIRFSLKRDKSRPMLYEYNITLRTIERTSDPSSPTIGFLAGLDAIVSRVKNTINVASGVINESINIISTVDKTVRSTILDPLQDVLNAITDFENGRKKVLDMPRKFLKDLKSASRILNDKLAKKFGIDIDAYINHIGGSSSFVPSTPRIPTYEDWKIINAFNKVERALDTLAYDNSLFLETNDETIDSTIDLYDGNINISKSNATKTIQILDTDTVQDIAARELGDASKFTELVIVNNLKYPYIDDVAGDGVLSRNDKILIPQESYGDKEVKNIHRNIEYEITRGLSEAEKNLGIDIKINSNQDLAITNTNDYDLLAGTETVVQMIGIRLGVEKGGYKLHTSFGVQMNIGEKNAFDLLELKQEIKSQLAEDGRLEKGLRVFLKSEGNTIYLDLYARIKATGHNVPLQLVSA